MFENIAGNTGWKFLDFNYSDLEFLLKKIPTTSGIYTISTNVPESLLGSFEKRKDIWHYNLSKKVRASNKLPDGCKIEQNGDNPYVVYSGHSYRLRQRASEHFKGSKGTGCLAIFQLEDLRDYYWSFRYLETSNLFNQCEDSLLLRNYLEQKLRSQLGWPILCSK